MIKRQQVIDIYGEPGGIRTHDPMIKSHVLYRLSYGLTCRINYLIRPGLASLGRPLGGFIW